jgi:hypothetical protein
VFTTLTVLTCYQIASSGRRCVRLQCWAEKRSFARLRALDDVVAGQPILLHFLPFVEDLRSISMLSIAYPFRTNPYPSPLQPSAQPHMLQCPFYPVPRTAALAR